MGGYYSLEISELQQTVEKKVEISQKTSTFVKYSAIYQLKDWTLDGSMYQFSPRTTLQNSIQSQRTQIGSLFVKYVKIESEVRNDDFKTFEHAGCVKERI